MGVNYDLVWYFGSEIEKGDEVEKERGDESKKFHKTILQTQNLSRMVNRGVGTG